MCLSEMEQDAITELLNVSVSRAAVALSRMVDRPVSMSIPVLRILSRDEALAALGGGTPSPLVAVGERFSGPFSGSALLVFPETRSLRLVHAILGERIPLEEVMDMAEEAMAEVGNVILNSCLSGMANMLACRIEATLPTCYQGTADQIFHRTIRHDGDARILFTSIDFSIRERDIGGYIVLLLDLNAIANLRQAIDRYIASLSRGAGG
ncbi:chemotaxis protein CheX [Azospirillum soli]|uniref:chemotaxis protein CheX n=1 Tax=Azospirillum soli TaxID=1304799 RepID=UPI001AE857E7|nr:chemotaxis protein CheX [Azospirillum soli]MBP2314276.1 chemotaxis protein CheC [Azospirillum soli]